MFAFRTARAQYRVDLIDENSRRLVIPCQVKQHFDQLFRITAPFTHNCRCTYVEKGGAALCRYGFGQHCLTCARRSKQKNTLPWLQYTLEKVRILHWHQDGFFQEALGLRQADNV